ncbi:hypothetical protein LCGC14_1102670 [marine sediment metagenome]|uniref:Uncharacterized protein n=1 Tax=marine sediment metagenome TaxID=412755 RepID=A0A0F9MWW1_9ZZZZ
MGTKAIEALLAEKEQVNDRLSRNWQRRWRHERRRAEQAEAEVKALKDRGMADGIYVGTRDDWINRCYVAEGRIDKAEAAVAQAARTEKEWETEIVGLRAELGQVQREAAVEALVAGEAAVAEFVIRAANNKPCCLACGREHLESKGRALSAGTVGPCDEPSA